ncbi:tyrosine-protein kinase Fer isoform X1 [Anopheles nili]|uniref:tyrosine-protein kinase Fer isoform X1 n=1 Tax=Anopheles nili TaxID=185578 RepID=UPI00237B79BC|nr:tyrosine-protein kinase Fer isoform X1 [Anopheles nili]
MGFSSALQGRAAHDALLNRQEAELKLLETMKRCLAQKAKCDREYAVSLAAVTQQGLKIDRSDDLQGSHIMRAWRSFMEELEHTAKQIRTNAEQLETVCHDKLASLSQEKRRVRKQYQEEHTKIATQFSHLTEDVARKKSEYQKHLDYYKLLRGRFEEHIKSGRSGRKLDDVIDKYQKACRKLHQAHNEYVLLITEAVEVEKDFRTILLPGLLEHQQSLQEGFIQAWSNLLQEIAKLSDTTSDKYTDIQRRIESSLASINAAEEYREFTEKHKTSPAAPVVFQFDESLVEDSLGKLQANTLTVDNLTVDWLRGRQTELEGTVKDLQDRQGKLCADTNGSNGVGGGGSPSGSPVGTPGTKPSTPILNGANGNGVLGKDHNTNKSSKELNTLRCQERQTLKLVDMIRSALNEVGCEELPSGCDDLSVEHLIENKKSVSQDLSVDSLQNTSSSAGGLFSLRAGTNSSAGGGGGGVMSMLMDQLRRKSGPAALAALGSSGSNRTPRAGPTPVATPKPGHRGTPTTTVTTLASVDVCDRVLAVAASDGAESPPLATNCSQTDDNNEPAGGGATYAELLPVHGSDSADQRLSNVYVDMEACLLNGPELERSFGYTNMTDRPNLTNNMANGRTPQYRRLRAQTASSEDSEHSHLLGALGRGRDRARTGQDDEDDAGSCGTVDELNDSKNNLLRGESFDENRSTGETVPQVLEDARYLTMKREDPEESCTRRWKSSIERHLDDIDALNQKLDEHRRLAARLSEEYEYVRVQTLRPVVVNPPKPSTGSPFEKASSFRERIKRRIKGAKAAEGERGVSPPDTPDHTAEGFSGRLRHRIAAHQGQRQFRLMRDTDSASPSTDRSSVAPSGGGGRKKKKRKSASKVNRGGGAHGHGRHGGGQLRGVVPLHRQPAFSEDELLADERAGPQSGRSPEPTKPAGLGSSFSQSVRATWRELIHSTNKVKDSSMGAITLRKPEEKLDLIADPDPGQGLLSIRFTFSDAAGRKMPEDVTDVGTPADYCVPLLLVPEDPVVTGGHKAKTGNLRDRLTKLVQKKSTNASGQTSLPEVCRTCSKRIVRPAGGIHPSQTVLDFGKEFPELDLCTGGHGHGMGGSGEGDGREWPLSEMINLEYEDIDVLTIKPHKLIDPCEGGTDASMTLSTNRPLHEEEWFHGVLPREEVVRLLRNEGDFLVRETTRNDESQTVLSVCWNGHKHFIVQTTAEGHYRFEGPAFPSIQELIVHQYQSELPVTGRSGAVLRKPVLRERWELSNDDVILLDKIGRGNFGDVYKAKLKSSKNTLVAVKTCRMTLPEEQKRKFLQEGRILKQYDHPNIVKLIGICVQKQPIMIVMELVAGGSLLMFLRKNASTLGQRQMMGMCRDAAAGMRYLESKNCIHRDLAARNCLIGSENIVKISDFGMSREEEEYIVSGGMKQIPIKWTAPEALNFGKYTSLCDVWSYGILVWEIFSRGDTPYSGMSNSMARERIDEGYRMPAPEGAPPEMYRLMLKCWSYEPESRPHFDEIYSVVDALLLCTKE